MSLRIWTSNRFDARPNEYQQDCRSCHNPVAPQRGRLISTATSLGSSTANGVLHDVCDLPEGWYFRAQMGKGQPISVVRALSRLSEAPAPTAAPWSAEAPPTEAVAAPEPAAPREPTEQELANAVSELLTGVSTTMLEKVPEMVRATLAEMTRTVEIKLPKVPAVKVENSHKILPDVVMAVVAGTHPFLVGPAGSGKTTLAMQVADTLKRKFYADNRITSEFKLLGYMDATSKYVRTQFREAYEKGGVFLLDEVDASDPDVLTTFNSALANGMCPFPDKLIQAHKDFVALAAGNTYGRGADREYVGRTQLDAATLDRFVVIEVDYDEVAELAWATNDDWTLYVQQVRKAIREEKIRHIVSPRASIYGARLLAAGMERDLVIERTIWKGLDEAQRNRINARVRG
jgi:cobaltochelatase CobS